MTTTVILVRHAPTLENDEHMMIGRTDPPLHDVGRVKANALRDALLGVKLDAIISSPLQRALETSRVLATDRRAIDIDIYSNLRELDLGVVDGVSSFTAYDLYREECNLALSPETADFSFPQGEQWSVAANRMKQSIDAILKAYRDKTVCVISHGGVLGLWRCRFEGITRLGHFRNMQPNHASFSVVLKDRQKMWIQRWNDTAHLTSL